MFDCMYVICILFGNNKVGFSPVHESPTAVSTYLQPCQCNFLASVTVHLVVKQGGGWY